MATDPKHNNYNVIPLQAGSTEKEDASQAIQKTRTGCATCRKRRVKCDEQKPHCRRCIKAQRQCEGYPFVIREARARGTRVTAFADCSRSTSEVRNLSTGSNSPRRHLAIDQIAETDGLAFAFYRCKVSSVLGGAAALDIGFWHDLVLQVADTEPAVQHAVFAVGNLFRHAPDTYGCVDNGRCLCRDCQNALQSYNRSIRLLSKRMAESDAPLVALIACVLFICLESFQGNAEQVLDLIQKGCSIMSSYGGTICSVDPSNTTAARLDNKIDIRLTQMFTRLRLLSSTYGRPTIRGDLALDDDIPTATTSYVLTDLTDARSTLHSIIEEAYQLLRYTAHVKSPSIPDQTALEDLLVRQDRLQASLQRWHSAFHLFTGTTPSSPFHESKDHNEESLIAAASLLEAYSLVTSIWLSTALSPLQSALDNHIATFEQICVLANRSLKKTEQLETGMPEFRFEMGWIPLLYFTATKCRHLEVRMRAVNLLRRAPEREGLWSRTEMVLVARRVIELEMSGGDPERRGPMQIDGASWPQEEARFHDVDIGLPQMVLGKRMIRVKYLRRTKSRETWESTWTTFEENLELREV